MKAAQTEMCCSLASFDSALSSPQLWVKRWRELQNLFVLRWIIYHITGPRSGTDELRSLYDEPTSLISPSARPLGAGYYTTTISFSFLFVSLVSRSNTISFEYYFSHSANQPATYLQLNNPPRPWPPRLEPPKGLLTPRGGERWGSGRLAYINETGLSVPALPKSWARSFPWPNR